MPSASRKARQPKKLTTCLMKLPKVRKLKMKNSFADIWADIGQEAAKSPKPHFLVRRVIPESSLNAFIGIEFPEDRRVFALEAALPAFDKLGDLPAFKGLGVSKRDSV